MQARRPRPTPLPDAILYPLTDAFRLIGVGRTKGFELVKEGTLKTVTVGGRRKVVGESLRALANGST